MARSVDGQMAASTKRIISFDIFFAYHADKKRSYRLDIHLVVAVIERIEAYFSFWLVTDLE